MKRVLRNWEENDLDSLVKHANNWEIARNLTNVFPFPYSREAGQRFIDYARSDSPQYIQAIDVNGEAVGGIGIHPQEDIYVKNAELGYWLSESYWGLGIMSWAIGEMKVRAFERFDIDRLFARPFGSNIGSQKALEKNGFKLEARLLRTIWKNDQYEDECIYAIRRSEVIKQMQK